MHGVFKRVGAFYPGMLERGNHRVVIINEYRRVVAGALAYKLPCAFVASAHRFICGHAAGCAAEYINGTFITRIDALCKQLGQRVQAIRMTRGITAEHHIAGVVIRVITPPSGIVCAAAAHLMLAAPQNQVAFAVEVVDYRRRTLTVEPAGGNVGFV